MLPVPNSPRGGDDEAVKMHEGQLDVSADLVAWLVADQFPQWAGLPVVQVVPAGSVNAIFRIGDSLAARFPLEAGDPEEIRDGLAKEARAAAEFAAVARVRSPKPVALGEPGHGYPLPWSVQDW